MKRRKSPFLVFLTCVLAVPTCGVLMGEIPSEGVNFDLDVYKRQASTCPSATTAASRWRSPS